MPPDVTKSAVGAIWVAKCTMHQADLTDFAQQITYRHLQLERPVINHHTDPQLARAAGFTSPVAEPLQYLAYVDNEMLNRHGERWLTSGELTVSILGPVHAGETIELRLGEAEESDGAMTRNQLAIFGPSGDLLTVGSVAVRT
jgi:MaoC like domain